MTREEIIANLEDQTEDRESSIDETDPDCIFRKDAEALREAVKLLRQTDKGAGINPVEEKLGGTMRLYDNEGYREEFMELVYALLASDGTNDRANLIIDAFDRAPEVEAFVLPPNDPLTVPSTAGMPIRGYGSLSLKKSAGWRQNVKIIKAKETEEKKNAPD